MVKPLTRWEWAGVKGDHSTERAAAELEDAVTAAFTALERVRAAIAAADRAGVGRRQIARFTAGLHSRPTVLKILAQAEAEQAPSGKLARLVGVRVDIKVGDERGSWGVVRLADGDGHLHVAIAGGNDVRIYERSEVQVPRPHR